MTGVALAGLGALSSTKSALGRSLYAAVDYAKELWKFCNLGDPELAANVTHERPVVD